MTSSVAPRRVALAPFLFLLALSIGALLPAEAEAQAKPRPVRAAPAAPRAPKKAPRVRHFDFTGDRLDGSRLRPDGTTVFGIRPPANPSLIRLRADFLPEILRSGERL